MTTRVYSEDELERWAQGWRAGMEVQGPHGGVVRVDRRTPTGMWSLLLLGADRQTIRSGRNYLRRRTVDPVRDGYRPLDHDTCVEKKATRAHLELCWAAQDALEELRRQECLRRMPASAFKVDVDREHIFITLPGVGIVRAHIQGVLGEDSRYYSGRSTQRFVEAGRERPRYRVEDAPRSAWAEMKRAATELLQGMEWEIDGLVSVLFEQMEVNRIRMEETPMEVRQPDSPYYRTGSLVTNLTVHMQRHVKFDGEGPIWVAECGGNTTDAIEESEIPEGFVVCQRCVEAVERARARDEFRNAPSVEAFRRRTAKLLTA